MNMQLHIFKPFDILFGCFRALLKQSQSGKSARILGNSAFNFSFLLHGFRQILRVKPSASIASKSG